MITELKRTGRKDSSLDSNYHPNNFIRDLFNDTTSQHTLSAINLCKNECRTHPEFELFFEQLVTDFGDGFL
jgi:hypothetical protein